MYKTTITIYSEYPGGRVELSDLAREAEQGDAYCATQVTEEVPASELPPGAAEFFAAVEGEPDQDEQDRRVGHVHRLDGEVRQMQEHDREDRRR